jgi:hypothetical protein
MVSCMVELFASCAVCLSVCLLVLFGARGYVRTRTCSASASLTSESRVFSLRANPSTVVKLLARSTVSTTPLPGGHVQCIITLGVSCETFRYRLLAY